MDGMLERNWQEIRDLETPCSQFWHNAYFFTPPSGRSTSFAWFVSALVRAKVFCPTYSPVVVDGYCRLCSLSSKEHRKDFRYSAAARKIQFAWFRSLVFRVKNWFGRARLHRYLKHGRKYGNFKQVLLIMRDNKADCCQK